MVIYVANMGLMGIQIALRIKPTTAKTRARFIDITKE
jgi:hypothetical protein